MGGDEIEVIAEVIKEDELSSQSVKTAATPAASEQDGGQSTMPGKTDFVFDKWSVKLARNTVKALRKEELTTVDTLILLTPEDTRYLGLTLAKKKLLDAEIAELRQSRESPSSSQGTPNFTNVKGNAEYAVSLGGNADATENVSKTTMKDLKQQKQDLLTSGKDFDYMFPSLPGASTVPLSQNDPNRPNIAHGHTPAPGPDSIKATSSASVQLQATQLTNGQSHASDWVDPRTVLTSKASFKKAVHITAHLSEGAKKRMKTKKQDTIVLARDHEGQGLDRLVLQQDDSHPYAGILISEWAAANCRVMNSLLSSGDLLRHHIEYYLAYTATVMDFASIYEWSHVLDFDFQYREHQAEHGFLWGYINPLLKMKVLGHPRQSSAGNYQRPQQANSSGRPRQQLRRDTVPECRQWKANNGFCAFGENCRYRHVELPQPNRPPPTAPAWNNSNQQPKNEVHRAQAQPRSW